MHRHVFTSSLGFLFVLAHVSTTTAHAQTPCDPAVYDNTCSGTVVNGCLDTGNGNTVFSYDCAGLFGSPEANTTCGTPHSCVDDGVSGACASATDEFCRGGGFGASCYANNPGVASSGQLFCADGFGCVLSFDEILVERCEPTSACTFLQADNACVNNVAQVCLSATDFTIADAVGIDCTTFFSTCVDTGAAAVCEGDVGALCADPTGYYVGQLVCASGLTCFPDGSGEFGTCISEATSDAGVIDGGGALTDSGVVVNDGGVFVNDGGVVVNDGGVFVNDGGVVVNDGGVIVDDGGVILNDGGVIVDDGGVIVDDSGVIVDDGGQPSADAGLPIDDDGPIAQDGCGDDLTALGRCDGDTLEFCQAGEVVRVDCTADELTCIEGSPSEGFRCDVAVVDAAAGCACVTTSFQSFSLLGASVSLLAITLVAGRRRRRS